MSEKKVAVVMTASGRVKEFAQGPDYQEIFESVYREHQVAGSGWDRPARLFVGGECVINGGLTDIAWEFCKFRERQDDMVQGMLDDWIQQRFGSKPESEVE